MCMSGLMISTSGFGSMSPAVTSVLGAAALHVEAELDRLVGVHHEDEVLEVEQDVGGILGDALDRGELVQLGVEPDVGDGGTGDRRQQGAPQRVAERVAEAGLERADGELLAVGLLLADGLDRGTLDDEQSDTSVLLVGFLGAAGYLE